MGYYTVESRRKRYFTAFSMDMAKEFCIDKLKKDKRTELMICKGQYVKYDVHREGNYIVFCNRDNDNVKKVLI